VKRQSPPPASILSRIDLDLIRIKYIYVCKELSVELSLENFIGAWNSIFLEEIEGVSEILEELRGSYRVVALSNTNQTHCEFIKMRYSAVLTKFKRVYYSHEILERKPNRGAYHRVLSDLEVEASEAVFLDDLVQNVEGARAVGRQAIHVTSFSSMVKGLETMGLLAPRFHGPAFGLGVTLEP
jgi:HAD superfamily hydrolase (TIGR01549 family)